MTRKTKKTKPIRGKINLDSFWQLCQRDTQSFNRGHQPQTKKEKRIKAPIKPREGKHYLRSENKKQNLRLSRKNPFLSHKSQLK